MSAILKPGSDATIAESPLVADAPALHPAAARSRAQRILYLDHTAKMGGGEIALLNLLRGLDRRRFEPIVILAEHGHLEDKLLAAGITTEVMPLATSVLVTRKGSIGWKSVLRFTDGIHLVMYVWQLATRIRRLHIDLLHTNSLKSDIIGGLAANLVRCPVLWHVRDRIASDYLPPLVVSAFRTACCTLADYVICPSEAAMSLLRPGYTDMYGQDAALGRLRVVHDGVAIEHFAPLQTSSPANGRDTLKTPRTLRVGLVGRISPFKGQDVFVEAVHQVHQEFPGVRFLIIGAALFGEADYERSVHQLVDRYDLRHCVEFTGFRSDVAELIADLDILVHASITGEPFGQVIVEGMAAGKPVIATNGGGVPEIVNHNVTGLLVPVQNATAIADAMRQLLLDESLRESMGRLGQARVKERFLIRHTVSKVEAFYEAIFAKKNPVRNTSLAIFRNPPFWFLIRLMLLLALSAELIYDLFELFLHL